MYLLKFLPNMLNINHRVLSKIVADDILIFFITVNFSMKIRTWHFMWNICKADESYEMSSLIFFCNIVVYNILIIIIFQRK